MDVTPLVSNSVITSFQKIYWMLNIDLTFPQLFIIYALLHRILEIP
jgi:hypothetical protein